MPQFQDQALPERTHIGVYEIKAVISAGRYGLTYRGWNHHLGTEIAVAEYFPQDVAVRGDNGLTVQARSENDQPTFDHGLQRFLEQADILSQIQHPSVTCVHNALPFNGTAYRIMQYEGGRPISEWCDPPAACTEADLRAILVALLSALEQVHTHGSVHGDIHPSNVLIKDNGTPLLVDFAADRLAIAARSSEPKRALRSGYAAPELYQPEPHPGPATDCYALGATLYRCITHSEPVAAPKRVRALNRGRPDPMKPLLGSANSTYSEHFLKTIDWMLTTEAEGRAQSASAVLAALNPDRVDSQAKGLPHGSEHTGTGSRTEPTHSKTQRWIAGGLGLVALSVVGVWYAQRQPHETGEIERAQQTPLASQESKAERPIQPTTPAAPPSRSATAQTSEPIRSPSQTLDAEDAAVRTKTPAEPVPEAPAAPQRPFEGEITAAEQPATQSESTARIEAEPPRSELDQPQTMPPAAEAEAQQDAKPTPISSAVEGTIQSHMAAAADNLAALRLTTPADNNAYAHYQAVLALDPEHTEARNGLQQIVDRYVWLIDHALEEKQVRRAGVYLQRAETIAPDAPALKRLRTRLARAAD